MPGPIEIEPIPDPDETTVAAAARRLREDAVLAASDLEPGRSETLDLHFSPRLAAMAEFLRQVFAFFLSGSDAHEEPSPRDHDHLGAFGAVPEGNGLRLGSDVRAWLDFRARLACKRRLRAERACDNKQANRQNQAIGPRFGTSNSRFISAMDEMPSIAMLRLISSRNRLAA